MNDKSLKAREWIILTFFLAILVSLIVLSKVSDVKADKNAIKVLRETGCEEH